MVSVPGESLVEVISNLTEKLETCLFLLNQQNSEIAELNSKIDQLQYKLNAAPEINEIDQEDIEQAYIYDMRRLCQSFTFPENRSYVHFYFGNTSYNWDPYTKKWKK